MSSFIPYWEQTLNFLVFKGTHCKPTKKKNHMRKQTCHMEWRADTSVNNPAICKYVIALQMALSKPKWPHLGY